MRPPICEICDAVLDAPAGGLVTFVADDASRAWRRRAEAEKGFVGHPPDTGWFCGAHIEAAREAATTMTYDEGVRALSARARSIDPETVSLEDPVGLGRPVRVPARSADGVGALVRRHHRGLLDAADADRIELQRSTSLRLGGDRSRTIGHSFVGSHDLVDRAEYHVVEGRDVADLVEVRVQRRGVIVAMIRSTTTSDPDAQDRLDLLQTMVADERFRPWVDEVCAELATEPVDLLDPHPDLPGAPLGAGRLGCSDGFDLQWVEWDIASVDVDLVTTALRSALPELCAALGAGPTSPPMPSPALVATNERTWNPMDGAQPPYCPYIDTVVERGATNGGLTVELRTEVVHWNDDEVNSATVRLTIWPSLSVYAFGATPGRSIEVLRLGRPTTATVVAVVDTMASHLSP